MCELKRVAIRIHGIVQGVGFRPFIFNLAEEYGLSGWVTNDSAGVLIEAEGGAERVEGFLAAIPLRVPPLARIDGMEAKPVPPRREQAFVIRGTDRSERVRTLIAPDMATCDDCLREMLDPADRRYLYPFINCTNCGPRFTIIEEMPYDRPFTTMREFAMCAVCDEEYRNPRHRRFHAQPNACPECGPEVRLTDAKGQVLTVDTGDGNPAWSMPGELPAWAGPVFALRELLRRGKIAAVKGIGGYHLVCNALDEAAVSKLRERKHRPDRPLAVMMPHLEAVRRYCAISPEEAALLQSPARPIVLLEEIAGGGDAVAANVAPGQNRLGVMLPYTPLHHLLFDAGLPVLVMTSGNLSGEPIIYDDAEAVSRLGHIVDCFLIHNRRIVRPCDDSVRRVDEVPVMIRRSRGYAPLPLKVRGKTGQAVLAAGGEMKNTFALARGEQVFLSQHIGDLQSRSSLHHYRRMIGEMSRLLEIEPDVVAYDLHPEYLSAQYVRERYGDRHLIGVQHHHAHIAGCMAEHGLDGEVIGIALDGTGYGMDGKIWGGEFLVATPAGFQRWAHLRYLPLPGGDRAVWEPWRIGAAYLEQAFPEGNPLEGLPISASVEMSRWVLVRQMLEKGIQTPETSSMGRLFDAVAAVLGLCGQSTFEGQAAMALEAAAGGETGPAYPFTIDPAGFPRRIDPLPMLRSIAEDLLAGTAVRRIAQRFHGTVAAMVREAAHQIRRETGLRRVVLSGGVWQNRLLLLATCRQLRTDGFTVYHPEQVPANDGGLALGQAYIAMCKYL